MVANCSLTSGLSLATVVDWVGGTGWSVEEDDDVDINDELVSDLVCIELGFEEAEDIDRSEVF